MVSSIQHVTVYQPAFSVLPKASSLQKKVSSFFDPSKTNVSQVSESVSPRTINFSALANHPGDIAEGFLWVGFGMLSMWYCAYSFSDLYGAITENIPFAENLEKIACCVKTAFIDLLSLANSIGYMAQWAHQVDVISLGQYLPIIKNLTFGTSFVISFFESAQGMYDIYMENQAIAEQTDIGEKEMHEKILYFHMLKLAGNVSFLAWSALGIIALSTGIVVSSVLMNAILLFGCVLGLGSIAYKMHLDHNGITQAAHAQEAQI